MVYVDWFTFLVQDLLGTPLLAILVTFLLYIVILKFGDISWQMIIVYLIITGTYFVTILYPSRAGLLLIITVLVVDCGFEALKELNKPESGS